MKSFFFLLIEKKKRKETKILLRQNRNPFISESQIYKFINIYI